MKRLVLAIAVLIAGVTLGACSLDSSSTAVSCKKSTMTTAQLKAYAKTHKSTAVCYQVQSTGNAGALVYYYYFVNRGGVSRATSSEIDSSDHEINVPDSDIGSETHVVSPPHSSPPPAEDDGGDDDGGHASFGGGDE